MDSCQNIETIDCELSVYRKGFLSVRLDIIWKDSNHWSNNFIRSLTFNEVEQIRCVLPDLCQGQGNCSCRLQSAAKSQAAQPAVYVTASEDQESAVCTWQMILIKQDQQWCLQGHDTMSENWLRLARAIEKISRLPVRL
jgi:hypothetical protein